MLIMRYKITKIIMIIIVKNRKMSKKKKKLFSRNRIYSLPHEGLFPHISVVTVTTFPSTSLIFSN